MRRYIEPQEASCGLLHMTWPRNTCLRAGGCWLLSVFLWNGLFSCLQRTVLENRGWIFFVGHLHNLVPGSQLELRSVCWMTERHNEDLQWEASVLCYGSCAHWEMFLTLSRHLILQDFHYGHWFYPLGLYKTLPPNILSIRQPSSVLKQHSYPVQELAFAD